jgi:hypothetical protein
MIEIDRPQLLRALDQRHDALVRQLDELNERIEHTLTRCGGSRPESAEVDSPSPGRS